MTAAVTGASASREPNRRLARMNSREAAEAASDREAATRDFVGVAPRPARIDLDTEGCRLPTARTVREPLTGAPWTPSAPIPSRIRILLCGHQLLVGKLSLLLIALELVVRLLRADIETVAHQRVGINVMNSVAVCTLHEVVRRQALQHRLPLGRVRRAHDKAGGGELVLMRRNRLPSRLACRTQS